MDREQLAFALPHDRERARNRWIVTESRLRALRAMEPPYESLPPFR